MNEKKFQERIARMREEMKAAQDRETPEERTSAQAKIARLEELGFFDLCGCSMREPD